jgi:ferredoxin
MHPARDTGVFQLHLPASNRSLDARGSDTLLHTMQAAGEHWPASCRNGTCRACIGLLGSGTVRYRVVWPGLLPEEKTQGCVLPCVAEPTSDVVLIPADG